MPDAHDGWGAGTTGGAAAAPGDVHTVSRRSELAAALAAHPGAPKIVYVRGTIEGNVDGRDRPRSCDDFADPGYRLSSYLAAYDPATWGKTEPSGPLEEARVRSQANQAAQVVLDVGPNTTVHGLGGATLHGLTLRVTGNNVILRNLRFSDAHDCFPQWDPLDGADGNWNSEYDNVDLVGATHVWVDHNEFSDGGSTTQPTYFGREYEVHDGLPTGVLDPDRRNTLALAVTSDGGEGNGLERVTLTELGSARGGVPVRPVYSPGWRP